MGRGQYDGPEDSTTGEENKGLDTIGQYLHLFLIYTYIDRNWLSNMLIHINAWKHFKGIEPHFTYLYIYTCMYLLYYYILVIVDNYDLFLDLLLFILWLCNDALYKDSFVLFLFILLSKNHAFLAGLYGNA
jgi:hypothetical protein